MADTTYLDNTQPLKIGATASMQVAADIRRRILRGEIVPGQRLKIDELAALCGVSHMPVRTALQELEADGIVIVHPRRGAEIQSVNAKYITNVFDVRGAIEVMLTGECAKLMDRAGHLQLKTCVEDFEKEARAGDHEEMLRANFRLHRLINSTAQNVEAMRVLDRGRLLVEAVRIKYGYGIGRISTIIDEHRAILDAIQRNDVDSARDITRTHCENAKEEILGAILEENEANT